MAAPRVTIRPETPGDLTAIDRVTREAFASASHASGTEHLIVEALRRAGQLSISLVAEEDGTVIGHVAVSPVSISDGSSGWYGLGPISVLPQHQGRGIGSALMNDARRALRERGAAGCVLVGDPAFYARFGFRSEPGLIYQGVPPEYFLVIPFDETVPLPAGTVSYHEAFEIRS